MDITRSIFILYQWYCLCRLFLGKFTPKEIRQAYKRHAL